jgi:ribosomal protein S18 acetylase RimI-like enzyme
MRAVTLTDRSLIRQFLMTDRFFADYALGDLDPVHFQQTEWWGAENNGKLRTLVMVYHDLTPPILFALGEARGIELLLDRMVQLPEIGLSIREEHLPVVEKFYRAKPYPMLKMALLPEDFKPVAPNNSADVRITRLEASHIPQLYDLYAYGGGDAFRPKSLEFGVFYGVFVADRLVAIAGTHIVSDNELVAALGNVMTHPQYRSQGLATLATSAVCDELLGRGIQLIGLSVGRSNDAAIRVYEKNGFKRRIPFYEGTAVRI